MKKIFTIVLFVLTFKTVFSQGQNAIDFDGIDDQVIVSNASSLINSGTGISMGMWVNPRNTFPSFPDFDCFGGFRNNFDADFYIIQISATDIEARFRNSAGINFDITYNGLLLNTWQHFAFTYDWVDIKLFHNGNEVGSQSANGTITNANENFYLGNGLYQGTEFLMNGQLDEVVLYNRALTANEISCMQHGDIDTASMGLTLYYNCNQGIAGGNNTGNSTLLGLTGQPTGTLTNFTLDGTNSNWVAGVPIFGAVNVNICNGEQYNYNGSIYSLPGTYIVNIPLAGGCDSLVTLTINLSTVDTALTVSNNLLTATNVATSYQWVRCDNNFASIIGATQESYNATASGDYAVIITDGACKDTSRCVTINVDGIFENDKSQNIMVWPVPAKEIINLSGIIGQENTILISDKIGRVINQIQINNRNNLYAIDISMLESGMYFINALDSKGNERRGRFIVQK